MVSREWRGSVVELVAMALVLGASAFFRGFWWVSALLFVVFVPLWVARRRRYQTHETASQPEG